MSRAREHAEPVLFLPDVIRGVVSPGRSGAYLLGYSDRGAFRIVYVGRSDSCLRTRLLGHELMYEVEYMVFRYTANVREAFLHECEYWHACADSPELVNRVHPATPRDDPRPCPYCEFARRMARMRLASVAI